MNPLPGGEGSARQREGEGKRRWKPGSSPERRVAVPRLRCSRTAACDSHGLRARRSARCPSLRYADRHRAQSLRNVPRNRNRGHRARVDVADGIWRRRAVVRGASTKDAARHPSWSCVAFGHGSRTLVASHPPLSRWERVFLRKPASPYSSQTFSGSGRPARSAWVSGWSGGMPRVSRIIMTWRTCWQECQVVRSSTSWSDCGPQ